MEGPSCVNPEWGLFNSSFLPRKIKIPDLPAAWSVEDIGDGLHVLEARCDLRHTLTFYAR